MKSRSSLGSISTIRRRLDDIDRFVDKAFKLVTKYEETPTIVERIDNLTNERDEARSMLVNMRWERDGDRFKATVSEAEFVMIEIISAKHYKNN